MKVVINSSYGTFALSVEAHTLYAKLKGYKLIIDGDDHFCTFYKNEESEENIIDDWTFDRSDPYLVQVVETLGEKAGHYRFDRNRSELQRYGQGDTPCC